MEIKSSLKYTTSQLNFLSFFGGVLTILPFGLLMHAFFQKAFSRRGHTRPLEYGFNVLTSRLQDANLDENYLKNKVFLEIAPGDNFSGPIAAVLLGAAKGIGVDAYDYTNFGCNLSIAISLFDRIPQSKLKKTLFFRI